jgi:hypothetical protein
MSNRPLWLAIVGAFVILLAIGLNFFPADEDGPTPPPTASAPSSASEPAAPADEPTEHIKPTFDVVRVNPQGDTVIAGRAAPSAKVTIFDKDQEVGTATADKRGEWVFVPEKPLAPGSRELGLESEEPSGHKEKSESLVILVVPERNMDIAGQPATGTNQALALRVPREGAAPTQVLQKPAPDAEMTIAIDAVDYDETGRVSASGRAPIDGTVRVYLDNRFVGQGKADGQGRWSVRAEGTVAPGMYTMRADLVDNGGKVLARASIPFSRAEPQVGMGTGNMIVVQPGNSLWRMARKSYGEGTRYTAIYEANKTQIKDADLIYPGQVFMLPGNK